MKVFLSAVFFVTFSAAADLISEEWKRYKTDYKKFYTTATEDRLRLMAYEKNKKKIEEHNKKFLNGEESYAMGINQFADWFPEELNKMFGQKMDDNRGQVKPYEVTPNTTAPKYVNWVIKGAVTAVKDQKSCFASYAFSAVGALEGLMFIKNKTKTNLSAQELVDCSPNFGCSGGLQIYCFLYVVKRGGISTEKSYPYEAQVGKCRADKGIIGAQCTDWNELDYSEIHLQNAVAKVGPISVSFAACDNFLFYKDGVYDGSCGPNINHAMLAVGYGTDKKSGMDYWLLKNSWGTKWGKKGFGKVKRGKNLCDIAARNSYPIYQLFK